MIDLKNKTINSINKQNGFTLVELIVVIVILGILAAVALPKFSDLSDDARKSVAAGLAGAIASGSSIKAAACAIDKKKPHCAQMLGSGFNGWAAGVSGSNDLWNSANPGAFPSGACSNIAAQKLLSGVTRIAGYSGLFKTGDEYFAMVAPSTPTTSGCWDGSATMTCAVVAWKASKKDAAGNPTAGARIPSTLSPMPISCY